MDKKAEAKALLIRFFQFNDRRETAITEQLNRFRQLNAQKRQARMIRLGTRLSLGKWILKALEIMTAAFAALVPGGWFVSFCIATTRKTTLMPGLSALDQQAALITLALVYIFSLALLVVACVYTKTIVGRLSGLLAGFRAIEQEKAQQS